MSWKPLVDDTTYDFEIVCPDGKVRHYPYLHEGDAEADARHAGERRCQFYAEPNHLEKLHGSCPGGAHRVRKKGSS